MAEVKSYDKAYKEQAVRLAGKIGSKKASDELGVSYRTLYGWIKAANSGELDAGERTLENNTMSLAEEVRQLRKATKELEKENKRLTELNEFLEEASAFFAASRQRSAKKKE
jgi:transposase